MADAIVPQSPSRLCQLQCQLCDWVGPALKDRAVGHAKSDGHLKRLLETGGLYFRNQGGALEKRTDRRFAQSGVAAAFGGMSYNTAGQWDLRFIIIIIIIYNNNYYCMSIIALAVQLLVVGMSSLAFLLVVLFQPRREQPKPDELMVLAQKRKGLRPSTKHGSLRRTRHSVATCRCCPRSASLRCWRSWRR